MLTPKISIITLWLTVQDSNLLTPKKIDFIKEKSPKNWFSFGFAWLKKLALSAMLT